MTTTSDSERCCVFQPHVPPIKQYVKLLFVGWTPSKKWAPKREAGANLYDHWQTLRDRFLSTLDADSIKATGTWATSGITQAHWNFTEKPWESLCKAPYFSLPAIFREHSQQIYLQRMRFQEKKPTLNTTRVMRATRVFPKKNATYLVPGCIFLLFVCFVDFKTKILGFSWLSIFFQ